GILVIYIGVTGWRDHYSLYPAHLKAKDKLPEYGSHFPVVEVDASFYAVQSVRNANKWVSETPDNFRFVVKAYQGMTGHERKNIPFECKLEMFQACKDSLKPDQDGGKVVRGLSQCRAWFDCKKKNVAYLRYCNKMMGNIP